MNYKNCILYCIKYFLISPLLLFVFLLGFGCDKRNNKLDFFPVVPYTCSFNMKDYGRIIVYYITTGKNNQLTHSHMLVYAEKMIPPPELVSIKNKSYITYNGRKYEINQGAIIWVRENEWPPVTLQRFWDIKYTKATNRNQLIILLKKLIKNKNPRIHSALDWQTPNAVYGQPCNLQSKSYIKSGSLHLSFY